MFANWVFVVQVDERSVCGGGEVGFLIDRLARTGVVSSLQVPPRPPKKTAARLSLFLLVGDGFPVPYLTKTG